MAKKKRTVMYSSAGKKLYAVRDEKGEFTDIQTYQHAQSADMRHKSKAELESAAKAPSGLRDRALAGSRILLSIASGAAAYRGHQFFRSR